jgi:hypothetical protein
MRRIKLTAEQADSVLKDGGTVHSLENTGFGVLVGFDFSRQYTREFLLREAKFIELSGPCGQSVNHGLVVFDRAWKGIFLETDPTKIAAFERWAEKHPECWLLTAATSSVIGSGS